VTSSAAATGTSNANGAFWSWSLEHYQRNNVETLALHLQDEFDFNVNILLWACWCAEEFEATPDLVLRQAIELTAQWTANVTSPLRHARRYLKAPIQQSSVETTASLRTQIKQSELDAEQVEQSLLEALAEAALKKAPKDHGQTQIRARRNLSAYAALIGAAKKQGFATSLIESLINHIFSAPPHAAVPTAGSKG
jgi:uncharacterized protein (TIGR02444 family)